MFSDLVCNRGTVVISGGLGGVAIDMSRWMIKKRAVKRIVLLSRRNIEELKQNSSQLNDLMNLIQIAKRHNASVEVMKADVTELDQVVEVIRRINENSKYPVRGIIHSAMVLHDCLLATMTQEMLSKVMQPKVCGAWNLHYATKILSCPISFFIMLSSIRNHMSDVGQSNYTAGNNFLDAIAHWRFNCKNLPALSVSLPAISGAGYIHKNPGDLVQTLQSKGIFLMPAVYVFKMIEQLHFIQQQQRIIKTDFSSPIMFVLNWKPLLSSSTNFSSRLISIAKEYMNSKEVQEEEAIIGHINNVKNQSSSLLSTLDIDIDTITNKIRLSISKLFGALSVDRVDLDKPLIHQGMDSLVAVEICNWLGKEMSVTGPLVELLQGMSINELASYVRAKLHSRQTNVNVELNNNKINESLGIETDNDNDTNSLFNVENNDIIESQTRHTGTSLIIPLHHSSFRQLLFCIHDMIGRPQTFNQLALKISQVYQNESPSIFAFRASGYESDEPYIQSVEMIAEEYILQMKRMQPTGPYNLVGYSFGGLIAYEMARQLYNYHGETVRSLILIDPPVPANENLTIPTGITENQYWSFGALGFIYSYLMLKENSFYHSMDEIMKSKVSEQQQKDIEQEMMPKALQALKQRFYPLKDNDVDSSGNQQHSTTEKMFQIIKTQYKAINHYTYSSAIDLNRSEIGKNAIMFTLNENNNSNSSNAKTNVHLNRQFSAGRNENIEQKHQLWENLLPNLKIEVVPGSHYTVLQPPFVDLIVQKLITLNIL
ncbi:unnamed protein product [Didymodactylos carnosus]|uniref:oleoyl-[acyl-carrier-protein] hydrolase n=1 Tax=Didymodactylos carnosus TaxID=1234261 RepID=A0A814HNT2_9BILA|nr:unnamed protein product [Didymodactylos carnosus]CAF1012136.1 unnamed protein product [Didymodactylos carnosus]CAF3668393.1 unnamed protein product [Didymodactylos carnosus]CAF3783499.1 unnamed protein product [Didymodactylos carnosus]